MTRGDDGAPGVTHAIAPDEALALLRQAPVGRLAVVVHGKPDIFPVNHLVDHGTIVFRTAPGTKMTAAHTHPVAFEVDGYDATRGEAWSVVVHGTGRLISETDDAIEALALPLFPWQGGAKPELVRIVPSEITGRRFAVAGGFRSDDARDMSTGDLGTGYMPTDAPLGGQTHPDE
jgi:hypothetical protein